MKKSISVVLAIVIAVLMLPCSIFSISAKAATSGIYTYTVTNGKVTITDVDQTASGVVSVPEKLESCMVTAIGVDAFRNCTKITKIILPSSLEKIKNGAFQGCSNLCEIVIPDRVSEIGEQAFRECFEITEITIPKNVSTMGSYAFYSCRKLKKITFKNSPRTIERYFLGYTAVEQIVLPESVERIEIGAFQNCKNLKEIVIPEKCTFIGGATFTECESLEKINLPSGLKTIEGGLFQKCSKLKDVNIPNSVTLIGSAAFEYCKSLVDISIPKSVQSIGEYAFSGTGYMLNASNWENDVIYIGDILYMAKSSISGDYTVKSNTRMIADGAFCRCYNLKNVVFPNTVTYIGESAFSECKNMEAIVLPDSVVSMGRFAFYSCINVKKLILSKNLKIIESDSFCRLENLESLTIPSGVTRIGEDAFDGCKKINSVVIPDSVIYLGGGAFGGCKALQTVVIGKGVKKLKSNTFLDCNIIESITIPKNVTRIECAIGDYGYSRLTIYYEGTEQEWKNIYVENKSYYREKVVFMDKTPPVSSKPKEYCSVTDYPVEDCTHCQAAKLEENSSVAIEKHVYGNWSTIKEATCTEAGSIERICKDCGKSQTKKVEALGHDFENPTVVREASLTSCGIMEGRCKRCDQNTQQKLPCAYKDEQTGINFKADEGVFSEGTEIEANALLQDSQKYTDIKKALFSISGKFEAFEIKALLKGEEITPNGRVTLGFSVPGDFGEAELYFVTEKNEVKRLKSVLLDEESLISAEVTGLGIFAICDTTVKNEGVPRVSDNVFITIAILVGLLFAASVVVVFFIIKKKRT